MIESFRLPERRNIQQTSVADPLKFYYIPIARSFYTARFSDAIRLLNGKTGKLLDVGCGSGIFLPELSRHCESLTACDFHPNLNLTAEMLRAESVTASLVPSDARALPFQSEAFDAIVCMSVLEHIHDLDSAASEFFRVLRPGGVAIIGVPVENLMTDMMLNLSYLSLPGAKLEDEHVSTHRDVFNAFSKKFRIEAGLNIPRMLPESFRMYSTARFRKPVAS
jgi:ubiquinone/menaquinone biosynthesis C-methylase UbiE